MNDISMKQFWLGLALLLGILMVSITFGTKFSNWCNYPNHEVKTDNHKEVWIPTSKGMGYYATEYRYDCIDINNTIQDVEWRSD